MEIDKAVAAKKKVAVEAKEESSSSDEEDAAEKNAMRVEGLKAKGNAAFAKKEFSAAAAQYSVACRLDPQNHVLFSNRSASYAGLQEWDKAKEDAVKVIKMKPDWPKGYSRLGAAFHGKNEWKDAVDAYKQGLEFDPDNAQLKDGIKMAIEAITEATGEEPTWLDVY